MTVRAAPDQPSLDQPSFDDVPDPVVEAGRARPLAPPGVASPDRATRARRLALAVTVAVGASALFSIVLSLRRDWREHVPVLGSLAFSSALTAILLSPRRRVAPRRGPLLAALLLVPAVFAALVVAVSRDRALGSFAGAGLCFALAMLAAALPLAAATFALQRSFAASSTLRGAAVGLTCGAVGTLSIHLHCPIVDLAHVLSGHGPPMLVSMALGALLGRRFGRV